MVCWVVSWSPSLAKLLFKRFECPEKHYIMEGIIIIVL